jgi:NADH-quinone oxidoreductase subunit L
MTFGTVAIAGIPPLAGFFSKDEILWRAYQASWAYWAIGLLTAFLTSFYMFRLWFLTFFGEYKGEVEAQGHGHDAHGHDSHGGHGHGGVHESPMVMVIPLVILAVLSLIGGWVGVPAALGGQNHFEKFLAPVLHSTVASTEGGAIEASEAQESEANHGTDLIFTGISVLTALAGFCLALFLYVLKRDLPQRIAASLGGFYHTVVHKYYVDEIYASLFVKPLIDGSTRILWHGVDQGVIDAGINGSAEGAKEISDSLRHMQSGNLRSYAGWIAAGAAAVIAYMVWMGTR